MDKISTRYKKTKQKNLMLIDERYKYAHKNLHRLTLL